MRGEKIYIPATLRDKVLKQCHNVKTVGHFGFVKTLHLVRRKFWWLQMCTQIETYVKSCPVCAQAKLLTGRTFCLLQLVADPHSPWDEIGMDFIVKLPKSKGYTIIWIIIDLFSKQAHFILCKGLPSIRCLARLFVQHIYRLHGAPKKIISDRGPLFTARFWKAFLQRIGTDQGLSSAFHPSTNGAAEQTNAMIERYLRSFVSYQQDDWAELLPFAETAYNNTIHSSMGYTPFRVVLGKDFSAIPELDVQMQDPSTPNGWTEQITKMWPHIKTALHKAFMAYKQQANKGRHDTPPMKVGDKVYLSKVYRPLHHY